MLEERVYKDYLEAFKGKNKQRAGFLSFIRAELKNSAINLRKDKLDDNEVLSVLKKQKKRLEETKQSIISSERFELLENTEKELAVLEEYLPKPLTEDELSDAVDRGISKAGATSMKDMGKVMKEVLAEAGVRVDAKKVSELVRNKLSRS